MVAFALSLLVPTSHACDGAKLEQARAELAKAPNPTLQRSRVVSTLAQACTFAPGIQDAVRAIPSATSAADAARLEGKAATQEIAAWTAACPGGKGTLDTALATTGTLRRDALWAPCDLQRFKYVTSDELAKADGHVILSILVAKHFHEQRVTDFVAMPLLRSIAGVGAGPSAPSGSGDVWATARDAAAANATVKWNAMTEGEWLERATQMVGWCDAVRARPPAERQKNRQVEYDVCVQAGRSAENANHPQAPLFRTVGDTPVNFGFYAAASTAFGDRALLDHTTDPELKNSVAYYVGQLEAKALPIAP